MIVLDEHRKIFMDNPILSTFHVRYESDFTNSNVWEGNTTILKDSLNNPYIRLFVSQKKE